ncbi:glycosyltransferase [Paenibacillus thalictri]|uniref:Glycosyltransferase family 1 protein n=1 Tax=Paenibacillus thalictri TaxID=2527873 RepID=A0A4Q9DVJ2_9BACL|nr:glycosyltransferase [Paenibacillus thalictri]TBL81064.1 glycosyltransferase family 1 protein [Paenibacillus thalictri]
MIPRKRILFITHDFSKYVQRSFHYFALELAKLADLTQWHEPGHIRDILDRLPYKPDFILINELYQGGRGHSPAIQGLDQLAIPFGVIVHDIHNRKKERERYLSSNGVRHIFSIYRDPFLQAYPQFADRLHWFPHFADTNVFRDYGQPKHVNYMLLGSTAPTIYPLRWHMLNKLKYHSGFFHKNHPGYRNFTVDEEKDILIGETYAQTINQAKIFLTCDSVFHYPVRKYFEVLACRTLLLAPYVQELTDLGFEPDKHFVPITKDDFYTKAEYYLNHEAERQRIADAGFHFIHNHHSAAIRAKQFLGCVETIMEAEEGGN